MKLKNFLTITGTKGVSIYLYNEGFCDQKLVLAEWFNKIMN